MPYFYESTGLSLKLCLLRIVLLSACLVLTNISFLSTQRALQEAL